MNASRYFCRSLRQTVPLFALLTLGTPSFYPQSQTNPPDQTAGKSAGTIRIQVGLVQTDLTVSDNKGRFVEGLKQDQFEMLVDGKLQPIAFLELVTTGTPNPETPPANTPAKITTSAKAPAKLTAPQLRVPARRPETGRTLLFFVDDWHMSADSTIRARDALSHLINTMMGPNDRAAVFTGTRQLGFLQQLTDNKSILQLAISRLRLTAESPHDFARPPMNEAQALEIEQDDQEVMGAFVDWTVVAEALTNDSVGRNLAADIVRHRAAVLAQISAEVTAQSLASLKSIVQSCAALPGHKVIFLLSDGFAMQEQRDDVNYRIRQVTDAAAAAGVVIYTFDTRGLVVGLPDASTAPTGIPSPPKGSASPSEPAGRLGRTYDEVFVSQDGLNALASNTGGRLFKNTNGLESAIAQSLEETSHYYLLGWHVDPDKVQAGHYSHLKISIKNRPDLKVNLRQDLIMLSKIFPKEKGRPLDADRSSPGSDLAKAVEYPWPIEDLPTSLYAGYVYLPNQKQYVLDISLVTDVGAAEGTPGENKEEERIDLLGIVANRDGALVGSFEISPAKPADPSNRPMFANHEFSYSRLIPIAPGIYQVRVAARDPKTGRVGSAHQWVEIPIASPGKPQLGPVFLCGQLPVGSRPSTQQPDELGERQLNAKRSFSPAARLSFLVQVFNAQESSLMLQAKIYKGNQVVLQSAPQPVMPSGSANKGPNFLDGELSLQGLAPGAYVLEVTTRDSSTDTSTRQQVGFWIR
ncbi:MAG: VWA domain-containing protein [Acidobacteriota bacterium]|jgi:VWFA-related protein